MQLVGVCGSRRVRGGLHLLGEVARAVQGVGGGPLKKSLLPIEEEQLQRQVGREVLNSQNEIQLLHIQELCCHLVVLNKGFLL